MQDALDYSLDKSDTDMGNAHSTTYPNHPNYLESETAFSRVPDHQTGKSAKLIPNNVILERYHPTSKKAHTAFPATSCSAVEC